MHHLSPAENAAEIAMLESGSIATREGADRKSQQQKKLYTIISCRQKDADVDKYSHINNLYI